MCAAFRTQIKNKRLPIFFPSPKKFACKNNSLQKKKQFKKTDGVINSIFVSKFFDEIHHSNNDYDYIRDGNVRRQRYTTIVIS